ncbi:MAG: beta-lactamase family protein [Gammaproteobacteria bacterium]|nr:beta-lactamase family protein [Gammaproteobacteria bacterium]
MWEELAGLTTKPWLKVRPEISIGLGWMLSSLYWGGMYTRHGSGMLGQTAMLAWSPETGTAIIILSNRRPTLWHWFTASLRL